MKKLVCFMQTPVGEVSVVEENGAVTEIFFGAALNPADYEQRETPLLREAIRQLDAYFAGKLREFNLPLAPAGTEFERGVWQALRTIPYGETRSYGQIAAQVGKPKASRAVGRANGKNPIPIVIPCHRVIGANGTLTGYGSGLHIKKHLLELES